MLPSDSMYYILTNLTKQLGVLFVTQFTLVKANRAFLKVDNKVKVVSAIRSLKNPMSKGGADPGNEDVSDPPEILSIMHALGDFGLEFTSRILYKPSSQDLVILQSQ